MDQLSFKQGIARIRTESGAVVGAGMLIHGQQLVTCAHVVRLAAGLRKSEQHRIAPDATEIKIELPFLSSLNSPFQAKLKTINWDNDIAVVSLPDHVVLEQDPEPCIALDHEKMPEVWRHSFRALGFPLGDEDGAWTHGRIMEEIAGGLYQIQREEQTGKDIEQGYSGTPIWNDDLHGIVGILTRGGDDEQEKVAYIIPVTALKDAAPDLKTGLSDQDRVFQVRRAYFEKCISDRAQRIEEELEDKFVQLTLMISQGKGKDVSPSIKDEDKFEELDVLIRKKQAPVFILLGAPGSGKTVLLERQLLQTARAALVEGQDRIPFFVRLNQFRGEDPLTWLSKRWEKQFKMQNGLSFLELLNAGSFLFLLDGLNEIPHADRETYHDKVQLWSEFLEEDLGQNRAIFTCRTHDYSTPLDGSQNVNLQRVQVEPLSEEKIYDFLKAYKLDQARQAWEQIRGDRRLIELYATPFFLKMLIDQLDDRGRVPKGRAALITGYVRKVLIREVKERHNLFLRRSGLLSPEDLIEIEQELFGTRPSALPGEGPLIPGLIGLAHQMQADSGLAGGLVSLPARDARRFLANHLPDKLIRAAQQLNLLTEEEGEKGRDLRFAHQLFQEYFAARQVAESQEVTRVQVDHRSDRVSPTYLEEIEKLDSGMPVSNLPTTGWEETMVLAAGMVDDPERFVRDLIPLNLPIAGRCAWSAEVKISDALFREVKEALLARMHNTQYDIRARLEAGLVLGDMGDPRLEDHGDYLLPEFKPVAGGTYRIGDDESPFPGDKPENDVLVKSFEIAVFPVTNAEYRRFIDDGGYDDETWWDTPAALAWLRGESTAEGERRVWISNRLFLQDFTDDQIQNNFSGTVNDRRGWITLKNWSDEEFEEWLNETAPQGITFKKPAQWENSSFNRPNQPVVGICWHEAQAYANWLSVKTGVGCDLPSEAEWEAATRRGRPNAYVYGPDYLLEGGNTLESHLLKTTPVGMFPDGASAEGLFDLSGNVWEWTISLWGEEINPPEFTYPYEERRPERENLQADDIVRRVLRGGSWFNHNRFARAAFRYGSLPSLRRSSFGFRLVRRPPSP